jgi:hypothetical protein
VQIARGCHLGHECTVFRGPVNSDLTPSANQMTAKIKPPNPLNFFSGELALQQGRKDEATRLLRIAAEGCPKDSFQLTAANAELKALGAQP